MEQETFVDESGEWELVGSVAVDSGSIVMVDPCYVKDMFVDWKQHCNNHAVWSDNWTKQVFQDPKEAMVFSTSGFGDGCYPVYARFSEQEGWGKRVAELRILFIPVNMEVK